MSFRCKQPTQSMRCDKLNAALTRLRAVINDAERLAVSHRDPEAFHLQKSQIVADLRSVERDLEQAR